MTLHAALARYDGKGPGFHFLRHALAAAILIYHACIVVTGPDRTPGEGDVLAAWAIFAAGGPVEQLVREILRPFLYALVAAFFFLSGFLVAGSAERTRNVWRFLGFRALRILPALVSEVTLCAIVLGSLLTDLALSSYFSSPHFYRYFGNIFGFVSFHLPGVFQHNPLRGMVNGNLWTLAPEFYCYFLMCVVMAGGLMARRRALALALALSALAVAVACLPFSGVETRVETTHMAPWYVIWMFFVGVGFWMFADRIPLHGGVFALAGAAYYALALTGANDFVMGLCLAYCVTFVGMMRFDAFDRLLKVDLSYGLYLYGFPIAQAIVAIFSVQLSALPAHPRQAVVSLAALALTALFAYASWIWIEKPALRLKKYVAPARATAAA